MRYDGAMTTKDKENWDISVEEEYNKINKSNVWNPIELKDFPSEAKILHSPVP